MKNVFKVLGIVALVAIVGFSMTACGDSDDGGGGGGSVSAGTWKQTKTEAGGVPTDPYTLVLGPNGGAWTFGKADSTDPGGESWEISKTGLGTGPAIQLKDSGSTRLYLVYEMSGGKLKIAGSSNGMLYPSAPGEYTKQ